MIWTKVIIPPITMNFKLTTKQAKKEALLFLSRNMNDKQILSEIKVKKIKKVKKYGT